MCDVLSIAVFCSKSIERFPCMASKFFFKPFVTTPVALVIAGIIIHFMFHSHCIYMHKLLYFIFFSASFVMKFLSVGIATSISMHVFSLLFLIIISGLFSVTSLSVCNPWFDNTVTYCSHTGVWVYACVCTRHLSVVLIPRLCIVSNANVHKHCVSLRTHSSSRWSIWILGGQ